MRQEIKVNYIYFGSRQNLLFNVENDTITSIRILGPQYYHIHTIKQQHCDTVGTILFVQLPSNYFGCNQLGF